MGENTPFPFQPTIDSLERISEPTDLIISGYLRASQTFQIYDSLYAELKVPGVYRPLEIERLNDGPNLQLFEKYLNVIRRNVAIRSLVISDPFKQVAAQSCDSLDARASLCGAVNLVIRQGHDLLGVNVDGEAFLLGLSREYGKALGSRGVFFGCGGVTTAVSTALVGSLTSCILIDIDRSRCDSLAKRLIKAKPNLKVAIVVRPTACNLSDTDFMYNGTGLGKMSSNQSWEGGTPLQENDILPSTGVAIDANYTPVYTAFLASAERQGLQPINGRAHMLGYVSLHVSRILGSAVPFETVARIAGAGKIPVEVLEQRARR